MDMTGVRFTLEGSGTFSEISNIINTKKGERGKKKKLFDKTKPTAFYI